MPFWSSEKIKEISSQQVLIDRFDENDLKCGAYELCLGGEAFLTSDGAAKKATIKENEQVVLPPGQLGLLLSEETVTIPNNAIGFISIKAGIKFRGLINISGFHVDPGFSGRLKFSVYNAGSQNVVLQRGQKVFLLWFADLDRPTQPYSGDHNFQMQISPEDVMKIHGEIASPGQLKKDLEVLNNKLDKEMQRLESKIAIVHFAVFLILTLASGYLIRSCFPPTIDRSPFSSAISKTNQTFENSETNR